MLSNILLYLSLITIVTFLTNGITTNLFTNNAFAQTQQNQIQQQVNNHLNKPTINRLLF